MRVGFFQKESSLVPTRVIQGNLLRFLGHYVEMEPLSMTQIPASALERRAMVDGDWLVGRLVSTLGDLEALELDYLYPLAPLIPYFFMARELSNAPISFLLSAPCVSPDKWFLCWLLIAPLLRPSDVIMIPNATARAALARISPVYSQQPALIPRSIDLHRVDRAVAGRADGGASKTLVYLGRLAEEKNVHLIVEALPDVLQRVPEGRLRLHVPIVSGGEANFSARYYQRIRRRCQALSLDGRVDFVEPPSEEAKYRSLAASAALVTLSLFSGETFGYSVLEALACGAPVVCTAWSGYKNLVADGRNGYLVPTYWQGNKPALDEEALKKNLIALLTSSAATVEQLRSQARSSAAAYDYRQVMPKLSAVLAQCSAARTAPSLRQRRGLSVEALLSQPLAATEGVWSDSLLRFEDLATLRYGALVGMGGSRAEMMQVLAFLRKTGPSLGRYLNAEYVSNAEFVPSQAGCAV